MYKNEDYFENRLNSKPKFSFITLYYPKMCFWFYYGVIIYTCFIPELLKGSFEVSNSSLFFNWFSFKSTNLPLSNFGSVGILKRRCLLNINDKSLKSGGLYEN